jgi:hypothetical protein
MRNEPTTAGDLELVQLDVESRPGDERDPED